MSEAAPATGDGRRDTERRALLALEMITGVIGLAGGVLLAVAPGGSLLRADPAVLAGRRFSDRRIPGVLLAGLVGGGFLLAAWRQWGLHRYVPFTWRGRNAVTLHHQLADAVVGLVRVQVRLACDPRQRSANRR